MKKNIKDLLEKSKEENPKSFDIYPPPPFNEVVSRSVIRKAKHMAWESLDQNDKNKFLELAEKQYNEESAALAIKCYEEAKKTFSEPGFISRADPKAYSDYKSRKKL